MMEKTKFYLTLQTGDWDPAIRGWRCSALAIPGAKVDSLLVQGRKIESHKYEVDASTRFLLWRDKTQPRDVTLLIELEKALTSEEETDRWKKLAVILPFCAALISAIVMYFTRQCPGPVPPVPVLDCKSSNPAFICSKTFKELYKKWPDIFAPLENFLRQPTLIYSTRDAVLTLREIKGNKVIFELDEDSQLENAFEDPITDSIVTKGDPTQEVISFEVFDDEGEKVPVKIEPSTINDGSKQTKHSAEIKVPPGKTFRVHKKFRLEKELVGEYSILTNKPIMKYYSMEFKIAPNLPGHVEVTPWKNGFKLEPDGPIYGVANTFASVKVKMKGPIYSGHGFIPVWSVTK